MYDLYQYYYEKSLWSNINYHKLLNHTCFVTAHVAKLFLEQFKRANKVWIINNYFGKSYNIEPKN